MYKRERCPPFRSEEEVCIHEIEARRGEWDLEAYQRPNVRWIVVKTAAPAITVTFLVSLLIDAAQVLQFLHEVWVNLQP